MIVVRVIDGVIRPKMKIRLMAAGLDHEVDNLGVFSPKAIPVTELGVGEVGFVVANIKRVSDAKLGDTITEIARPTTEPFPGFKELKPMVFAGLYPVEGHEYPELREALEKLRLNDASFFYEPESSTALGFGFRCGFLGLLHMEIVQERLEREYDMDLVTTAPGVLYRVTTTDGEVQEIDSPAKLPDAGRIAKLEEPVITATILTPADHVGGILQLCQDKRGIQKKLEYLKSDRVLITYELPFNEVVLDFYDKLKTMSKGYASLDYHVTGFWESPLVKMDILVNGEPVDALSIIVHRDAAYERGRALASKMRQLIPRQMFEVAIQASIGNRVIARESVKALRKNVLAKCYGGDITPQAQAAREAERGQEAHEAGGPRRDSAGGVPGGAQARRRLDWGDDRWPTERRRPRRRRRIRRAFKKSTLREYFESLCVAVILALFVRTFVVQAFKIPTGSMENNLLIGDHLLVNKMVFAPTLTAFERAILPTDPIGRGDIIVFKYPVEPERDYIKRVIGLPGDTLELRNKTRVRQRQGRSTSRTCTSCFPMPCLAAPTTPTWTCGGSTGR